MAMDVDVREAVAAKEAVATKETLVAAAISSGSCCYCPAAVVGLAVMAAAAVAVAAKPA